MRTVKKPEIRKQEILDGAMGVFLQKGYEKTTIADIARALGISQGLCYRYFASKEEIYDAVIDAYAERIAQENLKNRPADLPIRQWVQEIPAMLDAMERAETENPRLYAWVHNAQNQNMHRQLCLKVGEKLIPAVTGVLERARARGEIYLGDCEKTARFGIFGEIGLLLSGDEHCAEAIQEKWNRLLGIEK